MIVYDLIEHNFYTDGTTMQLFRNKEDAINEMSNRKARFISEGEMVTFEDSDNKVVLGWKPTEVYVTMKIVERKLF